MLANQGRILWSIFVLVILALGVFALGPTNRLYLGPTNPASQENKVVQGPPNQSPPATEMLPITIRHAGFVPQSITRPKGSYYIVVSNFSGSPELLLRLDRENGKRLHEAKILRQKRSWRQHLQLTPGTYVLTEANHPDWICRITITPN